MKRAFVIRSLLISLAALVIAGIVSAFTVQQEYIDGRKAEMREFINLMSATETSSDYAGLAKRMAKIAPDSLRVTYIAPDGTVLGDSDADPATMENHKSHEEVRAAMESGWGEDIRHSTTLNADMLYTAKKLPNGIIIRLSSYLKSIYDHIWSFMPGLFAGLFLALAVAVLLACKLSTGASKPLEAIASSLGTINRSGYSTDLPAPKYKELTPIVNEINVLSKKISNTLAELTAQRKRISYLLNNMSEGMILLDNCQKILLINRSARAFFGVSGNPEGKSLLCLTRIPRIIKAAQKAGKCGKRDSFDFTSENGGRILKLSVSPVAGKENSGDSGGVILLFTDVTPERRAEQIRSEFVANASHELKTPLTSIKGFAELMQSGIVTDPKKISEYLTLIHSETDRMIVLINDILKLSELESISEDSGKSYVSLLAIAKKVASSLTIQTSEKDVTVTVDGDIGIINANPDRMTQLVLNLMDNAVKYNRYGGRVHVSVGKEGGAVTLTVADTGIGIPPESADRVFERFYRVDKGHSRKIGGTGLGLSIVKHITGLYKGKIGLKSKVGKGTVIKVTLPASAKGSSQPRPTSTALP